MSDHRRPLVRAACTNQVRATDVQCSVALR